MLIERGKVYGGREVLDIVIAPKSIGYLSLFYAGKFVGQAAAAIEKGDEIVFYASERGWFAIPMKDFISDQRCRILDNFREDGLPGKQWIVQAIREKLARRDKIDG